jgi:hypothetical protein
MIDPVLKKFESEWDNAILLVDRAIIVYNLVAYVKLRYRGVDKLSERIAPKVSYLEDHVEESSGKEFLKIQRVIGYARRTIADCGNKFGSGFRRVPTAAERKRIAKDFPRVSIEPSADLEPQSDLDLEPRDDFHDVNLGNGAA